MRTSDGARISTLAIRVPMKCARYVCFLAPLLVVIQAYTYQRDINDNKNNVTLTTLSAHVAKNRRKRYLVFPQGSNVQLVFCLTIGSEGRPSGELVVGMTAALAWELPAKIVRHGLLERRSRGVVYPKIEAFLQSLGIDGRACVMRAICETGRRSRTEIGGGDFIHEILHAVFTIPNDGGRFDKVDHRDYDLAHEADDGDCAELYPSCGYSIYDLNF